MKILLISSVLPRYTIGGEMLLYRHLSLAGLHLVIATDNAEGLLAKDLVEIRVAPLLNRLTTTRLSRGVHDIRQCFKNFYNCNQLLDYIQYNSPDLILTVAHGELCWLAHKISRMFNIPLVTFFHDWWPDLAYVHDWARKIIEIRFKALYQYSKLALCISEGMRQALGIHPNAQILLPIPEQSVIENPKYRAAVGRKFKIIYTGIISGIYSSMLQSLCTSLPKITELQFKLFGPQPDWSDLFLQKVKVQEIYAGFISRDLLSDELSQADALLVVMSFEQSAKKRMETSFPSKLVDYCQFGKPIIIWGPNYCSAVQWGRHYESALVVTSPSAKDLVEAIKELAHKPLEQKRLGDKASEMAQGMFNPEKIQQQFIESIQQISGIKGEKTNT